MDLQAVDDRKIIERVLNGDTNAFNLLVWQWERPIFNYILRMVGDRDEAMDLCQECFLKAFRELAALKDRDRFSAWLYRIAHNTTLSRQRKDWGKTFVPLDPDMRAEKPGVNNRLAVEKALLSLSEEQRQVVVLKVYQDLKFDEIAEIQGAPVSTVKSRLYLAFEKLRGILGE